MWDAEETVAPPRVQEFTPTGELHAAFCPYCDTPLVSRDPQFHQRWTCTECELTIASWDSPERVRVKPVVEFDYRLLETTRKNRKKKKT